MIKATEQERNLIRMRKQRTQEKVTPPKPDPNIALTRELAEAIKMASSQKQEPLDLSPLIEALISTQATQNKLIDSMQKPKVKEEWEFAVKRNASGEIETVMARNV